MKKTPTQIAMDLVGTYLTQALPEASHTAVNRVAAAARYIEADTNLAFQGIKDALKKARWFTIAEEYCDKSGIINKHNRQVVLQAVKIEAAKQEGYWRDLDLRINRLANLENVTEAHLTELDGIYNAPEFDTNVNAAILSTVALYCKDMEPVMKRQFAKVLEGTMKRQVKLGLIRE